VIGCILPDPSDSLVYIVSPLSFLFLGLAHYLPVHLNTRPVDEGGGFDRPCRIYGVSASRQEEGIPVGAHHVIFSMLDLSHGRPAPATGPARACTAVHSSAVPSHRGLQSGPRQRYDPLWPCPGPQVCGMLVRQDIADLVYFCFSVTSPVRGRPEENQ
jgi:hypothetical protein